jgi:fatty-acyl-CoA synthase
VLLLGDILRRHAAVRGGKTAYVVGDERVTYADFHARSNRLARALARLGVGRGDRVAVLAPNRVEYPIIYFAVLKLGAIVVPVSARFTAGEVAAVVGHAGADTFLVAPELEPLARGRRVLRIGPELDALAAAEPSDHLVVEIDEHDPHVMLYTSGTTGQPKGTLLSHRSYWLQATTSHLQLGIREEDVGLSMFPMFHMGGWSLPLGFWHTGATIVIMPKAEPDAILEAIARERVTYLYAVPTVYRSLLGAPGFAEYDTSSLRLLGGGTAAMTAAQIHAIRDGFRCRDMVILYGSTEAGPVSVLRPADVARKPETVGRPYLDVDVRLVDEDGRDVPRGGVGEIVARSEFTMRGYWRNPEESARTKRDGWVHTGDLGAFDEEGFLSVVGRRKEVIRSAGESIFPAEIERVLLDHPDIREASVLAVPDDRWGEAVVAAIVLEEGATLDADAVVAHVRAHLAGYKKPKHVCFLPELPRTAASRQVHKALLRDIVLRCLGG